MDWWEEILDQSWYIHPIFTPKFGEIAKLFLFFFISGLCRTHQDLVMSGFLLEAWRGLPFPTTVKRAAGISLRTPIIISAVPQDPFVCVLFHAKHLPKNLTLIMMSWLTPLDPSLPQNDILWILKMWKIYIYCNFIHWEYCVDPNFLIPYQDIPTVFHP